jgi:hypothetical protein
MLSFLKSSVQLQLTDSIYFGEAQNIIQFSKTAPNDLLKTKSYCVGNKFTAYFFYLTSTLSK